jgi:hypothetical protein
LLLGTFSDLLEVDGVAGFCDVDQFAQNSLVSLFVDHLGERCEVDLGKGFDRDFRVCTEVGFDTDSINLLCLLCE